MSIRKTWLPGIALCALLALVACTAEGDSPESDRKEAAASSAASPAMLEKGRAIYKTNCVTCHGESGKGDGPAAGVLKPPPRDHTDASYMRTLSDKDISDVIVMGGAIKGRPLMPSHPQLRGDDLNALVAYVRSLSAK